jgi:hypothetical protein
MPIDDELLDTARTIHDEMLAYGMTAEAAAIRHAVSTAVAEQEEEDRFGTDRISACIDAVTRLRSSIVSLADDGPIMAGDISTILKASVPDISLMVEAEDGPTWLRNMVVPINDAVRRLVSELGRDDPRGKLGSGSQIRLADCVSSLGMMRAGDKVTSEQT